MHNTALNTTLAALILAGAVSMSPAEAAVSASQAAALKTTLTPLGGERAGNADGSIPAWTGVYTGPSMVVPASHPDPFAGEKPLLTITPQTAQQYAARLPQGAMELFKRYPSTFRVEVFPTHRTAIAPQLVYDNTFTNATHATLIKNGYSLKGAYGGIPFPLPQSGLEVMWNSLLHWQGVSIQDVGLSHIGTTDGKLLFTSRVTGYDEFPYYYPGGSADTFEGVYQYKYTLITDPAYQNGNATLSNFTVDPVANGTPSWQYLPGQRRVRKSPNLLYDMPNFFLSGLGQFDEAFGFNGPLDEYTWTLGPKKEMYVPYNENRMLLASYTEQMSPKHHYNPDLMRWELHRVYVVDANLAPGRRNVVKHRRFYIDEDTWLIVGVDEWDNSDSYWRFVQNLPVLAADIPAVVAIGFPIYDFKRGDWTIGAGNDSSVREQWKPVEKHADFFTPDNLAASGVR